MQKIDIQAEYRKKSGKGIARQLRMSGKMPAVIYSKGASTPLVLNPKEIQTILHSAAGENTLITLHATGETPSESGTHVAILRDFQKDPLSGEILHADLFEISLTEPIDVKVTVELTGGVPIGVKRDGGVLRHHLRDLEIRCLPTEIPDHVQIDISSLAVGETIHVKDLSLEEGIETLGHSDLAVVSVTSSMSEEKLEALLSATPGEAAPETTEEKTEEE